MIVCMMLMTVCVCIVCSIISVGVIVVFSVSSYVIVFDI